MGPTDQFWAIESPAEAATADCMGMSLDELTALDWVSATDQLGRWLLADGEAATDADGAEFDDEDDDDETEGWLCETDEDCETEDDDEIDWLGCEADDALELGEAEATAEPLDDDDCGLTIVGTT